MNYTRLKVTCSLLVIFIAASGCLFNKQDTPVLNKPFDKAASATIKVLGGKLGQKGFAYTSTNEYYLKITEQSLKNEYPHLKIEYIPPKSTSILVQVDEAKPDIIWMTDSQYQDLSAEGKLLPLDTYLHNDDMGFEKIYPPVMEWLKTIGGSNVFGLAPFFDNQVLYYNMDLFDQYKIPYPQDSMTWEDIMYTAAKFPKGKIGLYVNEYADLAGSTLLRAIGSASGLNVVNAEGTEVSLLTDAWIRTFNLLWDGYRTGNLSRPLNPKLETSSIMDLYLSNSFTLSNAAMSIDGSNILQGLILSPDSLLEGEQKFPTFIPHWGAVNLPKNPAYSEVTEHFTLPTIIGISAGSAHIQAALAYLKEMNSEAISKQVKQEYPYALTATDFGIREFKGDSLEVFYKLKPNNKLYTGYKQLPLGYLQQFDELALEEMTAGLKTEGTTAENVLESIQEKAQRLLDKLKMEKK